MRFWNAQLGARMIIPKAPNWNGVALWPIRTQGATHFFRNILGTEPTSYSKFTNACKSDDNIYRAT